MEQELAHAKILILLTDGSQTDGLGAEDPSLIANELRKSGIHIVVVGIGKGIDIPELIGIAGERDHVFTVATFEDLLTKEFVGKVSKTTCGKFLIYELFG